MDNTLTDPLSENTSALPEALRQQYLEAMGIQAWFDPEWIAPQLDANAAQHEVQNKREITSPQLEQKVELNDEAPLTQANAKAEIITEASATVVTDNSNIDALNVKIKQCEMCELHTTRQQAVCGEGNEAADLFIVIDSPVDDKGEETLFSLDDKQMLRAMLSAIGFDLSAIYISSLVKCKPPAQRAPQTSEMICCDDHLSAQIKIIQPQAILILGEQASQQLLVSQKVLTDLRLRRHQHLGVPVFASYHPHELFNSTETKRKVWADLLQIKHQITINN